MFKISSELFNKVWSKWWTRFKEIHSHGLSQLPSAGGFSHLCYQSHLATSHFALSWLFSQNAHNLFSLQWWFLLRNFIEKTSFLDHCWLEYTWQFIPFYGKKRIIRNRRHFNELFNDSRIHKNLWTLIYLSGIIWEMWWPCKPLNKALNIVNECCHFTGRK